MQGDTVDEAAHQGAASGPQQLGADIEAFGEGQRMLLAGEQMARQKE